MTQLNRSEKALFYKPDYVEMAGRYFLLLHHGHKDRLEAFVHRRREAAMLAYAVGKLFLVAIQLLTAISSSVGRGFGILA